jgi:hypothetical protein
MAVLVCRNVKTVISVLSSLSIHNKTRKKNNFVYPGQTGITILLA